jgi:hypothetical protein
LRLEFIAKASTVASKRRAWVRRSWISCGLGRFRAFFRNLRTFRTDFCNRPLSSGTLFLLTKQNALAAINATNHRKKEVQNESTIELFAGSIMPAPLLKTFV